MVWSCGIGLKSIDEYRATEDEEGGPLKLEYVDVKKGRDRPRERSRWRNTGSEGDAAVAKRHLAKYGEWRAGKTTHPWWFTNRRIKSIQGLGYLLSFTSQIGRAHV